MIAIGAPRAPAADATTGTLVIHGGGTISGELRNRFIDLAGGSSARLIVIPTADPDTPDDDGRLEAWRRRMPHSVALLHARSDDEAKSEEFAAPLRSATGVWISGGRQTILSTRYAGTAVERELVNLLTRGGVIGGSSAGAAIMSRVMIVRGNEWRGFDLLRDGVVDQHFRARSREDRLIQVLKRNPGRFGLGVDEDTAAIVRGSTLEVLGASDVMLCLPMTADHPAKVALLRAGQRADLDEFRREARARVSNP